jgi:uncharacterized protein
MRFSLRTLVLVPVLAGVAASSVAATPTNQASTPFIGLKPSEVAIPLTRRIDFTSSANGNRYSLLIALPDGPPPPQGYPVVYVIDGVLHFGAATEAARGTGRPAVVVGLSYPFDDVRFVAKALSKPIPAAGAEVSFADEQAAIGVTRDRDLTPPTSREYLASLPIPLDMSLGAGGADAFLKMIELDVKPRIAAMVPVDAHDQALVGHSLGGLTVLRALFTEPKAFRTFVAASPSIWWNNRSVLVDEAAFGEEVRRGTIAPRVLITVGGREQTTPKVPEAAHMTQERFNELIQSIAAVDNANNLAARLKVLKGASDYAVESVVFADEGHVSVEQAAISRAINFALQRDQSP